MTTDERPVDPRTTLKRVAIGYRSAAVAWVAVLAAVAIATDPATPTALAVASVAVALGWATATVALGRDDRVLRHPAWIVADVAVCGALIAVPAAVAPDATAVFGGYPFSAVVLAAWAHGFRGAIPAGLALAAATISRTAAGGGGGTAAGESVIFYLVSAGVLAWGVKVLVDADDRRRAAEADLEAERLERRVATERAETAAHLHDSVLQTLALIQRRADRPSDVVALARGQERDLREWLYAPPGTDAGAPTTLGAGIRAAAADVERAHGVPVDVVVVGDAPASDEIAALVAAAREAMTNAAVHSGAERVSVYAESAATHQEVFVRDRGSGFDTDAIAPDRRGVRESICGRMERHGGRADVRSSASTGTEVVLRLPADAPEPEDATPG